MNYGSYKYKNINIIGTVMLTYSWVQFIDVLLCILYMAISLKHVGEFEYVNDLWFYINCAFVDLCGWLIHSAQNK